MKCTVKTVYQIQSIEYQGGTALHESEAERERAVLRQRFNTVQSLETDVIHSRKLGHNFGSATTKPPPLRPARHDWTALLQSVSPFRPGIKMQSKMYPYKT